MEKIKQLFAKLAENKKLLWIIGGAVAVLVIAGILIAVFAGGSKTPAQMLTGCTVTVKTEGGLALEGIGVYIYEDSSKEELVTYVKTDATGSAAINVDVPAGSVLYLENVPAGYAVSECYTVSSAATEIILSTSLLAEMGKLTLGGVMFDFTVTDTEGKEYTLSKLLKEKKAVMLNLWYTGCGPCKAEFPFLQQAYMQYSSNIEVLALNPVAEDDASAVSAFKTANNLTFPMAKCDETWAGIVDNIAYPTTVVIDRFGTVALIHTGGIDNTKIFEDAFAYFTADDYVQTAVANINELVKEEETAPQGTVENPYEFAGVTQFEVTVEPGQTAYCNLYRVSGMELSVTTNSLKIGYNQQEFEPINGVLSFPIATSTDPSTPAMVMFTNTGVATQTYQVTLAAPLGSMDNPIPMELGDLNVEITGGNSQGIYYACTTDKAGTFTLTVKKVTKDVMYNLALNNLSASKYLTIADNGKEDTDGNMTLSFDVSKNDNIQLIVSTQPDANGTYPAASFKLNIANKNEDKTPSQGSSSGNSSSSDNGGSSGSGGSDGNSGTLNTNGTLVNPDDAKPVAMETFETESIGGGQMVLYAIRGIGTATIKINDDSAYIIYNEETYIPKKGVVSIKLTLDDAFAPAMVTIGNGSSSAKTYKVSFSYPSGSQGNPKEYELNKTVSTTVAKGNDEGIYYTYTAAKAGTLTIKIESCSVSSGCGVTVTTKTGDTIQETVKSTEGDSVTIKLDANQKVEIIISALPDSRNNYPKATIKTSATLT